MRLNFTGTFKKLSQRTGTHKIAVTALCCFCFSGQVSAYNLVSCNNGPARHWDSSTASMRVAKNGFGTSIWLDALFEAAVNINQSPANFRYGFFTNDEFVGVGNGQSEIWWESAGVIGAPADAVISWNCRTGVITEADMRFDNGISYTTSTNKSTSTAYGGGRRPFQNTATHEFGHVLGLGHTANVYSIMGTDWTHTHANGGTLRSYFGEDGAAGAVDLYGLASGVREDLSVSHWRRSGSSGGYSVHSRVRIFTKDSNTVVPRVNITPPGFNAEPGFRVNAGQTYDVEFTYENSGRSEQTTEVGFFISTDHTISATADTRIGGLNHMTWGRNSVNTERWPVRIPSNLVSGRDYWLGVMIDEDETLNEIIESNNFSYIPIRIN